MMRQTPAIPWGPVDPGGPRCPGRPVIPVDPTTVSANTCLSSAVRLMTDTVIRTEVSALTQAPRRPFLCHYDINQLYTSFIQFDSFIEFSINSLLTNYYAVD